MTKRQYKNRIKKVRVNTKRVFYIRFRPMAQKLFFPICALILLIGILNYERNERGTMEFTNAAVVTDSEKEQESFKDSAVAPINTPTLVSKVSASATPGAIETKILEAFNGDKVALAVAKSESGLDPNAKGYNCRYNGISKSCKPEDRDKAWSVDCSIFQINFIGTECPEHLMDVETNIAIAKEMQSKRGWNPWVGYWTGQWKNHLN